MGAVPSVHIRYLLWGKIMFVCVMEGSSVWGSRSVLQTSLLVAFSNLYVLDFEAAIVFS